MPAVLDVKHLMVLALNQESTPNAEMHIHTTKPYITETSFNYSKLGIKIYPQNHMTTS